MRHCGWQDVTSLPSGITVNICKSVTSDRYRPWKQPLGIQDNCRHSQQSPLELGDIMILSFIVILKCHDNRNRKEIFNIVISPTRYYRKYCDYRKIHCSETFISVKYFQLISTILVPIALLSDIMIISIIVIITLMIYRDMKFLLSPIPRAHFCKCNYIISVPCKRAMF